MKRIAVAVLVAAALVAGGCWKEKPAPAPPTSTAPVAKYDIWNVGQIPNDKELVADGFAVGDVKWINSRGSYWLVSYPNGIPSAPPDGTPSVVLGAIK